jgi:hypothetical protein
MAVNSTLLLVWTWLAIGGQAVASGGGSDAASPDVLQGIGDRMRQVQQRLLDADDDNETRAAQQQIADRLRALIESLEAQQRDQLSQSGASRQDQPPPSSADPDAAAGTEAAQDSAATTGQADDPVEDATAILSQAAGAVWGHLPERYRARMRSAEGVEFLPQYRTLIEDYYRRLAEDQGRTP